MRGTHTQILTTRNEKEIPPFAATRMSRYIMLHEISQAHKEKLPYDLTLTWNLKKTKVELMDAESRTAVSRAEGTGVTGTELQLWRMSGPEI